MQQAKQYSASRSEQLTERVPPVLSDRGFLLLWLGQVISQTAQNAILYALIIIVLDLTESTTSTSGVVLSFVIPTVLFGIFAGVLTDRWSKRRILIWTNAVRAVCTIAYFFARDHYWALYAITVPFASASQLFTTATAASIPFMVSRQQLISANSLFSGAFTMAQIAGLIVLSPLILKTGGPAWLFASACAAFAVATVLGRMLPYIGRAGTDDEEQGALPRRDELRGAVSDFAKALGSLRHDTVTALAMVHITVSSTLVLLFAILVPRYMQAILEVGTEDAVAVFAPVAIGALLGLRLVPLVVSHLGKTRTVALGLFGLALCLGAIGFVETIAEVLHETDRFNPFATDRTDRIFGLSILVALTMLIAGPLGLSYAMLNTPAQTTLHERTPIEMRGRVIASQMVLANGVALFPLVVVGGIADLYGVSAVVLAIGALLAAGGALTLYLDQRWVRDENGGPPAGGTPRANERAPVPGSIDTTGALSID
jgi:MFS family permease